MFLLMTFWFITSLICAINFKDIAELKIPHNVFGKILIKVIKFNKIFYKKFSSTTFFTIIDYIKCPFFVLLSALIFQKTYITDLTAILSYFSHYFPIWHFFKSNTKNFISVIFTGFILDPITGLSMVITFLFSAKSFGYSSVATTSAMIVGMIKTIVHILFFKNKDYIEALFFIFFGCLAIYRNRKAIRCICEKSVKKDINIFKKLEKTNVCNKNNAMKGTIKIVKNIDKYSKKVKKSKIYKNYKKFYKNYKKFEEKDRKYVD